MRPEHFIVGDDAKGENLTHFELPVQYAEKTGSDGTAYLSSGDEQIAIRVAPQLVAELVPGKSVKVAFPSSRLSVFDATTERRI